MSKKRRSVFTLLLFRIIAVVIIINLGMAYLQISEALKLQKKNVELSRARIQNEITGLLDTWNAILESTDKYFGSSLKSTSEQLIRLHERIDLGDFNPYDLLDVLNVDTTYYELNILKNGIIVNTTESNLLGKNEYEVSQLHKERLIELLENGKVLKDWHISFSIDRNGAHSPRFQGVSYQATADKKYITELSAHSRTADELMKLFADRVNMLKIKNVDILYANAHFPVEVQINKDLHFDGVLNFLNESPNHPLHDSLLNKAFKNKENVTHNFFQGDRERTADYFFYDLGELDLVMDKLVFSVITDITDHKKEVFSIIRNQLIIILCFLILLSTILILATTKLKTTLKDLLLKTTNIAKGNLKERVVVTGHNEFTTLAEQFNTMVQKLELSQNELKLKNQEIEASYRILQERNEEITSQNDEISAQRDEIEAQRDMVTKQKDQILEQKQAITDSIIYASRIQSAVLPPDEVIKYLLPKHFILYKPRDIVSGDFYWLTHLHGDTIIAVADCTGHGVPGAFMSMLGIALLNETVNKIEERKANLILNELRDQVILSLRQSGKMEEAKDGMDISLCIINKEEMNLQYAGANNQLYLIRKGELIEIKGDSMPIGISSKAGKSFTNHEMKVFKDDSLYLFSDGYVDQFGGERRRKFMSKRLKQLLIELQDNIMFDQKEILEQTIQRWMGKTGVYDEVEQIDDMIIMGIKI